MNESWKFIELGSDRWVWDRGNSDGTSTRVGMFRSRAECVEDARRHGYRVMTRVEKREIPRDVKLLRAHPR
jgi:hypothetical protein